MFMLCKTIPNKINSPNPSQKAGTQTVKTENIWITWSNQVFLRIAANMPKGILISKTIIIPRIAIPKVTGTRFNNSQMTGLELT